MWPAWTFGNISAHMQEISSELWLWRGRRFRRRNSVLQASRRSHQAQTKRHFKLSSPQKNSCQSSDSKHWWPLLNLVSTRGLYEWVKPASGTPSLTGCLLYRGTFACVLSSSRVLTHFRGGVEGRWSGGAGRGCGAASLSLKHSWTFLLFFSPTKRGRGREHTGSLLFAQKLLCRRGSDKHSDAWTRLKEWNVFTLLPCRKGQDCFFLSMENCSQG